MALLEVEALTAVPSGQACKLRHHRQDQGQIHRVTHGSLQLFMIRELGPRQESRNWWGLFATTYMSATVQVEWY